MELEVDEVNTQKKLRSLALVIIVVVIVSPETVVSKATATFTASTMNHASFSPGQPNEAAGRKVTPSSRNSDTMEGSASSEDNPCSTKKQSVSSRFLMGEDLQKIRHSSHRNAAREEAEETEGEDDMGDNEHSNVIKDLLYPALEEGSSRSRNMELDFFEEDYQAAQVAMNESGATVTTAASTVGSSFRSSTTISDDSFRFSSMRSSMTSMPETGNQNDSSFSSSVSNSSYLNALRRRGSTTNPFDASIEKRR
jgi:hypothetical protein